MSKTYDRPIIIQKVSDEATEKWVNVFNKPIHASINKAKNNDEFLNAGAIQSKRSLVFEVRYFADLEPISLDTQSYRIVYQGVPFNIVDYDDYMLKHKTVKLLGESY